MFNILHKNPAKRIAKLESRIITIEHLMFINKARRRWARFAELYIERSNANKEIKELKNRRITTRILDWLFL